MQAMITDIKRFAVHDGNGIRTTVFFKGCPLRCRWCHNPETLSAQPQLAFYSHKCTTCHTCADLCAGHSFDQGTHTINRHLCTVCGKCAACCPQDACEVLGKAVSVEEIIPILLRDRLFYDESGGGVTLSGGECLLQADFCAALLSQLKKEGIHTAVDTCGYVPREAINQVLPFTDCFLYDIKAFSEEVHQRCTGKSNRLIIDNLRYLDSCHVPVEIRIPYVPGRNDDQIEPIGRFLTSLSCITAVKILPYHNYAASKYLALAMENTLPPTIPTDAEIQAANEMMRGLGLPCR